MRIRIVIVALLTVGGSLAIAPAAQAAECGGTVHKTMAQKLMINTAGQWKDFYGNRGIAADLLVYETYIDPAIPASEYDYYFSNWYLEINDGVSGGKAIRFGIVRHRVVYFYEFGAIHTYGDPTIRVEWGYPRDNAGHNKGNITSSFDFKDIRSYPGNLGSGQYHRLKFFNDPAVNRWRFYIDDVLVWTTPSGHPMNSFNSGQAVAIHYALQPCSSAMNTWSNTWRYSSANKAWIHLPNYNVSWRFERDENPNWNWDNYTSDGIRTTCVASPCQVYSS